MDMSGRTVTVGAWARSRGIPRSTAYAAAQDGRLPVDARGRVDPEEADRTWPLVRIDTPVPRREPDPEVERAEEAIRRWQDPDWEGDEGDPMVSVKVAEAVDTVNLAVLMSAQQEVLDSLAPVLARMRSPADVRALLHDGLDRAAQIADQRIRRHWDAMAADQGDRSPA